MKITDAAIRLAAFLVVAAITAVFLVLCCLDREGDRGS